MRIGVAFQAEHPSLTGYNAVRTGTQDNSVATGLAYARD
jgi:hypothetical protein